MSYHWLKITLISVFYMKSMIRKNGSSTLIVMLLGGSY